MAKIDEIKKKLANNNLISIENCKPYSVPEILQEHTIKINELISKQEDAYVLNITMYGCVGDYKTINSKQLQLAIDNAVEQKIYEIIGIDVCDDISLLHMIAMLLTKQGCVVA